MITNLKLDLTDAQREQLGMKLTGKKGGATRKQITTWAMKALADALAGRGNGKTELKHMVCPKCSRPIAVNVPVVEIPVPTPTPVQTSPGIEVLQTRKLINVEVSPQLKALEGTPELAAAIRKAAEGLQELAAQLPCGGQ